MQQSDIAGNLLEVQTLRAEPPTPAAPLVFLHEGLGSVSMWRDWPGAVGRATGRTAVVYSRQGYGRSAPVRDVRASGRLRPDYLHREAFEVLPALLDQLGISHPVLLGHSDGASIALLHASRFPVRACIAMAPHIMVEDLSLRSIEAAREAFLHGNLRQRLAPHHADVDGAFWQWNDAWLNPAFRDFDIRTACSQISAPVLAIQGSDDSYGTMAQIDEIALPETQITRLALARCGHSPHRDAPDATLAAIVGFLSAIG